MLVAGSKKEWNCWARSSDGKRLISTETSSSTCKRWRSTEKQCKDSVRGGTEEDENGESRLYASSVTQRGNGAQFGKRSERGRSSDRVHANFKKDEWSKREKRRGRLKESRGGRGRKGKSNGSRRNTQIETRYGEA